MENSNTAPPTQDPPATEPTEAMVDAAARAISAAFREEGSFWDGVWESAAEQAAFHDAARAALIAGIAAALEKGR